MSSSTGSATGRRRGVPKAARRRRAIKGTSFGSAIRRSEEVIECGRHHGRLVQTVMPDFLRTLLVSAAGRALGMAFPRRVPPQPHRVQKLLVIKPAAHGDIVFASAAIAALRRAYDKSELTLAVSTHFSELADGGPGGEGALEMGRLGTTGR